MSYFTGDTKTFEATFNGLAPIGTTGPAADPDSNLVTVTIYDADEKIIETGSATRTATGVYEYAWTFPQLDGTYYLEFKGFFAAKPELIRSKYSIKFKP